MREITREDLSMMTDPSCWGVRKRPDGNGVFPDGSEWGAQEAWPCYLRRALGPRVSIMGFWCHENVAARLLVEASERHDFAVIDGRWLVDGWVRSFSGAETDGIYDLADPDELSRIRETHGEPGRWHRSACLEAAIDMEGPARREAAMQGVLIAAATDTGPQAATGL